MSAQENSNPATVEKKYDITDKNDGCKHRPCKYTVPSSFVNPGVKANDRQFVNLDSDTVMYDGPNSCLPKRIHDHIPGEDCNRVRDGYHRSSEKENFSYVRGSGCDEANMFSNRMIYNRPNIDDHLKVCEGFQSSSDDKTLDTILYIIIAVILIYALYKCCCCPKRNFKPNMEGGYDEEMVDDWDD